MKTVMKFFFEILGMCFMVSMLAACSDNDNNGNVSFKTAQLEIDRLGGYSSVEVDGNGLWVVTVPAENEWITVLTTEGHDTGTIQLYIEDNPTLQLRKEMLTLTSEDGTKTQIPIVQTYLLSGETTPDNTDMEFYDVFNNKGIGRGYDILNRKTKQSVVQMTGLKELVAKGSVDFQDLYYESSLAASNVQIVNYDSLDNKLDSIDVKLTIGVSFGLFKLDVKGQYVSSEKATNANVSYKMGCRYPVYEAGLEYASLLVLCDEEQDVKKKRQMLSIGFLNQREKITRLAKEEGKNSPALQSSLRTLDNTYGPMVVTGTTLGGELTMELSADSTKISDIMKISGTVDVAIKAVVSIEGNVSVDYVREGTMILDNSNLELIMLGGEASKGQEMAQYLTSSMSISRAETTKLASAWANSITVDSANKKKNTAEVVEMTLTPIWTFFDEETEPIVREFIVNKYKNNNKCIVDFSEFSE